MWTLSNFANVLITSACVHWQKIILLMRPISLRLRIRLCLIQRTLSTPHTFCQINDCTRLIWEHGIGDPLNLIILVLIAFLNLNLQIIGSGSGSKRTLKILWLWLHRFLGDFYHCLRILNLWVQLWTTLSKCVIDWRAKIWNHAREVIWVRLVRKGRLVLKAGDLMLGHFLTNALEIIIYFTCWLMTLILQSVV